MITLDITIRIYKNLVNPVLGTRKQHQTGFFSYDVIAFESTIRGYVENVFFPLLGRAATPKKKSLIKSMMNLMSLGGNDFRGVNPLPVTEAQTQKIDLVIKVSKAVSFIRDRILKALSFRFLFV